MENMFYQELFDVENISIAPEAHNDKSTSTDSCTNFIYDASACVAPHEATDTEQSPFLDTCKFIKTLCGNSSVTYQTFDDDNSRKLQSLSKIYHGDFKELIEDFDSYNEMGAGVFLMVNEGDGDGRSAKNVTKVRALFLDLDGSPLQPVLDAGLIPHIIVESSPERYHAYWLVGDCPLERFKPLQQQIAKRFNGDKSIVDLSRVMRLPGFLHKKDKNNPFRTRVLHINDIPHYKVEDVVNGLDLTEEPVIQPKAVAPSAELSKTRTALKFINAASVSYAEWRNVGFGLHDEHKEIGFVLFDEWSQTDVKRYDNNAIQLFWSNIKDNNTNKITIATVYDMAKKAGWTQAPPFVEELNMKYFVAPENGKVSVYTYEFDESLQRERFQCYSFKDFANLYSNKTEQIGIDSKGNPTYDKKGNAWLNHPSRRQYSGIVMAPGKLLLDVFNRWRGFTVEAKLGSWQRMRDHIYNNICSRNQELFEYVMGWLARLIQHPESVGEVAIVLKGGRGIGKSRFAHWICELLGQHSCHITDGKQVTGNFNAHLQDCVFLFIDEAIWAGDKQAENILKGYITEQTIAINQKFRDLKTVPNRLHIVMASNNDWVVPAGFDERRFCVIEVSEEHKGDFEYFKAIEDEMKNGGLSAMLYDLYNHDISNFQVRNVPQTEALLEQKIQSFDPIQSWWFSKLEDGTLISTFKDYWDDIPCEMLYNDYINKSCKTGISRKSNQTLFGIALKKLLPKGWPKKNSMYPSKKMNVYLDCYYKKQNHYQFPPLQVCRSHFEGLINAKINWELYNESQKQEG